MMSSWQWCCLCLHLVCLLFISDLGVKGKDQNDPHLRRDNHIQTIIREFDNITDTIAEMDGMERRKRLLQKDPSLHWPKGIIPFKYSKRLTEEYPSELKEIAVAMSVWEHYTPIRFVPWTDTINKDLGLGHHGFAIFVAYVESASCSSMIGNQRDKNGQRINCCQRKICVHEIGHLLGFNHEHQHQDRDEWIRLDWDAIGSRARQFEKLPTELFEYRPYDLSSYMHYPPESPFGRTTLTFRWNDINTDQRHFYMFKELCAIYKCHEFPQCKSFELKCRNEGYVSVVDNKCTCLCPAGLDSRKNCNSPIQDVPSNLSMPKGTYGVLQYGDVCPNGPFQELQDNNVNKVCMRTTKDCQTGSKCGWPYGTYCFLKKGKCPTGTGITSGKLTFLNKPEIRFCCFENGFPEDAVQFPNTQPFSLYMKHSKECQQIIGMHVEKRSVEYLSSEMTNGPYNEGNNVKRRVFVCDYTPVDIKCGSIIKLSKTNRMITIQSDKLKSSKRDCTWLIKGIKKSTLVLNFEEFHVRSGTKKCIDTVTVKHARIGYAGNEYCGKNLKHSIRSIDKKMMIRFKTGAYSNSHFKATITMKTNIDLCYDPKDKGLSYGGKVSYTRHFVPCVQWKDATHCHYNTFQGGLPINTLEQNYCRNPDNSFRPWCYTNVEGCVRDFCDVCHYEKAYDHADDCDQYDCTKDHNEVTGRCAKTCQVYKTDMTPKISETKCSNPGSMRDGALQSPKSVYNVGDTATYQCTLANSGGRFIERKCLSTGEWSTANTACTECPIGFGPYNGHCYQYIYTKQPYDQAVETCRKLGAYLASVKSKDENDHVNSIRLLGPGYLWLGGYYNKVRKMFVWQDGSPIDWFNFALDPPKSITKSSDMHITLAFWNRWERFDKKERHALVCKTDAIDNPTCEDYLDGCQDLLKNKGNVDCSTVPKVENVSPGLRNLCRFTCGLCLRGGCGTVINLNEANTQATFEATKLNKECTWAINAPPNKGSIVLHFDEFNVGRSQNSKCDDVVEVRISNLGKLGTMYCGNDMKESVITTDNKMLIMYRSQAGSSSHFQATVKWIPKTDWCYKSDDKGSTYAGHVSYTQNFRLCKPWYLATKCLHHPYHSKDLLKNLEKNYCRNPDNSPVPWCYTDVDTCQRESCDVCNWAMPFDRSNLCQRNKKFCSDIPKTAIESCAATCSNEIIQHTKKVSEVSCDPPNPDKRGSLQSVAKASYSVGNRVTFQCSINSNTIEELICLTSGQWAVYSTQCADCPVGQASFKDNCYNFINKPKSKGSASEFCKKTSSKLATAKTKEENRFLDIIREADTRIWLGGDGAYNKVWKWNDGTPFDWTNWRTGGIINKRLYNCLFMDFNTKWQSHRCYSSLYFICKTKKKVTTQMTDIITACPSLLPRKDMCGQYPRLANLCPSTCGN